jgi:hypothetical protein
MRERFEMRLGSLKEALAERCARDGVRAGAFIREVLRDALAGSVELPRARRAHGAADTERSRVRLPPYASSRLRDLAARAGMSQSALVTKLVLEAETSTKDRNEVSKLEAAIEALYGSNHRLLPIGTNLNQVARSLNSGDLSNQEQRQMLEGLAAAVRAQLRDTTAVLAIVRPSRPTRRHELSAMAQTLGEMSRASRSSRMRAAHADSQRMLVDAIAGALAHVKVARQLLPCPSERGWGGRDGKSEGGDDDGQEVD